MMTVAMTMISHGDFLLSVVTSRPFITLCVVTANFFSRVENLTVYFFDDFNIFVYILK